MNDNSDDLFNLDLTKLNLIGCGLFLSTLCCCCGGTGVEMWLLFVMLPDGGWVPKLLFVLPWIGALVFFWVVRAGLQANGISIFRKPRKKKKKKRRRLGDYDGY